MSWQEERQKLRDRIAAELARLGVSVDSTFIPYSQSKNKAKKWRSLNWKVRLKLHDRVICETDYAAGEGHCPAYNQADAMQPRRKTIEPFWDRIDYEIEHGFESMKGAGGGSLIGMARMRPRKEPDASGRRGYEKIPILPDTLDVVASLVQDARVLDHSDFESWASDTGSDPDSRADEAVYRACLDIALKLRSGLGAELLIELEKLFEQW